MSKNSDCGGMGVGCVKKGHILTTTSNPDGVGIYKGGGILVFEPIAIVLSGKFFFVDILNMIVSEIQ